MSLQQVTQLAANASALSNFGRSSAAPLEGMVLTEGARRTAADVASSLDTAQGGATRASDVAAGIYERQVRGLGVQQTAAADPSAGRRLGLSRALTSVDARNREVQNLRGRTDIARSAAGDLRSALEQNAFGAQSASAGMAADREVQYQQELAKYKQDKAAGLGQLASLGAMFIPGVGPLMAAGSMGR